MKTAVGNPAEPQTADPEGADYHRDDADRGGRVLGPALKGAAEVPAPPGRGQGRGAGATAASHLSPSRDLAVAGVTPGNPAGMPLGAGWFLGQ